MSVSEPSKNSFLDSTHTCQAQPLRLLQKSIVSEQRSGDDIPPPSASTLQVAKCRQILREQLSHYCGLMSSNWFSFRRFDHLVIRQQKSNEQN